MSYEYTNSYRRDPVDRTMTLIIVLCTLLVLGLIGWAIWAGTRPGTVAVAEDCDQGDQREKDDDCGYWTNGVRNVTGAQPSPAYTWMWYSWVVPGQLSIAPNNWKPPRGITPPTRKVKEGTNLTGKTNVGGQPGGSYGGKGSDSKVIKNTTKAGRR